MRGKAQPDDRPAVELIETLSYFSPDMATLHVQSRFSINNILLQ